MIDIKSKSIKLPTKIIIPVITFIIGAVFFYIGCFKYGFWDVKGTRPTKGFFPVIIAVGLMALSVLAFINGLKGKKVEFRLENWLIPASVVLILLASYVFGLVISISAFIVLWLKLYEKQSWKIVIITLAIVLLIVVGAFQLWLGIDFPMGIILDAILG